MAENEEARDQILIVAICGSLRPGSYTRMALQVALRGARETGAEATLIDLRDYQLAFCDGKEDDKEYPKDVFRLREEVKSAHGLILGTPEYHGGVSGVLKNALDLMGFEELEGKMIGLIGVSRRNSWRCARPKSSANSRPCAPRVGHSRASCCFRRLESIR